MKSITIIIFSALGMLPLLMQAAQASDKQINSIEAKLFHCREQIENTNRLNCYDAIVKNLDSVESSIEKTFGKKQPLESEPVNKLYMQVVKVKKDPYKSLIISFDNGQVWKQKDTRRYKIKAGETVYIERGALGSFMLGQDKTNSTIRVKRIQ